MFERSPYSLFEDLKPFSVGLNYHHHNSQVAMWSLLKEAFADFEELILFLW